MKKSILVILLSLLFYPFLRAQNSTLYFAINSVFCTSANNFSAATGCDYWVSNSSGDTVYQSVIPSDPSDWALNIPYNVADAPYFVNFDSTCLVSQGVNLFYYTFKIMGISPSGGNYYHADSVSVCQNTAPPSGTLNVDMNTQGCNSTNNFGAAAGCDYWVRNANGDTVYQAAVPSNTTNWALDFPYSSADAPYHVDFDSTCLNTNGVMLNNYSFQIRHIHQVGNDFGADSVVVCDNGTQNNPTNYTVMVNADSCNAMPIGNAALAVGCGYWVEDVNGNIVYQDSISNTGTNNYLGYFTFPYNSQLAPYSLHYDSTCLTSNGIDFSNYTFSLDNTTAVGTTILDTLNICTQMDSSVINASCADLYCSVSPWVGYYQNQTNLIRFDLGNNSNTVQSAHVEIQMPSGVTPVPSSFGAAYTVSGSILTIDMNLLPQSNFDDIIIFNVPGGITSGTLHVYSISIQNNDTATVECTPWNNYDSLYQVVGNSYDPNAKTVSMPKDISSDVQDEFVYTIYFQNTGTAPAQNIYIMDTLGNNLDWSTFEFLRASDVVGISDLGNGIKKFQFDNIWLPDSSADFAGSHGFVSFKIKENTNNDAGTEILNTAYIYFDQNAPIVTNTTYNINVENLGLKDLNKNLNLKLFPNPANASVSIKGDSRIDKLAIYSVDGKLCWSSNPNKKEVKLDVSDFTQGLYIVKVQSQESSKTLRFIKR